MLYEHLIYSKDKHVHGDAILRTLFTTVLIILELIRCVFFIFNWVHVRI